MNFSRNILYHGVSCFVYNIITVIYIYRLWILLR